MIALAYNRILSYCKNTRKQNKKWIRDHGGDVNNLAKNGLLLLKFC